MSVIRYDRGVKRDVAAVILAGGTSRRFGQDKAQALLGGSPLLHWVVRALSPVAERIVVAARPSQQLPLGGLDSSVEVVVDRRAGEGPMAGLEAAFWLLESGRTVVVSCDAPLLVTALATELLRRIEGADAAVPVVRGHRQPLVAAYEIGSSLPVIREALDRGERRLLSALEDLAVLEVLERDVLAHDPELRSFENVNTPEALLAIEARLPEILR